MSELFLTHLFGSQPCEALFRQIRSFTSTYSTVANCTVKEILARVSKIQLQNDTACNTSSFTFPRAKNIFESSKNLKFELPTDQEIYDEIEKSKSNAIKDAIQIGLIGKKIKKSSLDVACKINPYIPKTSAGGLNVCNSENEPNQILPAMKNIMLKD